MSGLVRITTESIITYDNNVRLQFFILAPSNSLKLWVSFSSPLDLLEFRRRIKCFSTLHVTISRQYLCSSIQYPSVYRAGCVHSAHQWQDLCYIFLQMFTVWKESFIWKEIHGLHFVSVPRWVEGDEHMQHQSRWALNWFWDFAVNECLRAVQRSSGHQCAVFKPILCVLVELYVYFPLSGSTHQPPAMLYTGLPFRQLLY